MATPLKNDDTTLVGTLHNDLVAAEIIPVSKIALGAVGVNDGYVATGNPLPITVASLPLPAGASIAAKQPALGTAGVPSADVISVQGVAGGTAIPVSGSVSVSGTVPVSIAGTVNVNTELAAASILSDNMGNPTTPLVGACVMGLNASSGDYERVRTSGVAADGSAAHAFGCLDVQSHNYVSNGTTWDRMRGDATFGVDVDVTRSALPTGASTLAEQQSQTTQLNKVVGKYVDFDTGPGGDSVVAIGLLLPAAGGAVIGGTSTNPIRIDPTNATPQDVNLVTGQVGISAGAGPVAVNTPRITHASDDPVTASLNVMDDWDETDRCKVNLVIGQAGVTAGSGVVTLTTLRVTLATDIALPAGNNNIGDVDVVSLPPLPSGTNNIGDVDVVSLPSLPTGNNNIGDVDVASLPALPAGNNNIGDVDVASLPATPAGTNLIGKVSAGPDSSVVYDGTTALTPKFAKISAAASGDNTLVAGVASKKIRVLSICLINSGTAVSCYFTSATAGTAIFADVTNKIPLDKTGAAGAGGFILGSNPQGWMETSAGQALVLNLSAAQGVCGGLTYVEV